MEIREFEGQSAPSQKPAQQPAQPIEGWGADRRAEDRPGIPRETRPSPLPGAAGIVDQQRLGEPPVHADRLTPTPVFGGKQPTHGLSGRVRRAAYRIPNHKVQHWLMLLLADRIDILESRLGDLVRSRRFLFGLGGAGVLAIAGGFLLRGRR